MSSPEKAWRTAWLRGGKLSEVTWIGRDVLGWCAGLHLVFFDVPANRLKLLQLTESGDTEGGASCLSGHLRHRVFAYAEKNFKPRIFVCTYPSMTKISTCSMGTSHTFLATVFHEDFMISLGSMFQFRLTVWAWRTGDKIISVSTPIHDAEESGQILRTNFVLPMFIGQIGNKSGKIISWECNVCSSVSYLTKNEIILPNNGHAKDMAWCYEDNNVLAIADREANIFVCSSRGKEIRQIIFTRDCRFSKEIEPSAICWYRGGFLLRTTYCHIRYYRKDDSRYWQMKWFKKLDSHPYIITMNPLKIDPVIIITREGLVFELKIPSDANEPPTVEQKYFRGGLYRFIQYIHPWDDYIAAVDNFGQLSIVQTAVGAEVSKVHFVINGKVTHLASHPNYPLVIISSDLGEVVFVSIINYQNPKILGIYWMQEDPLSLVKFSNTGRYAVACQKDNGMCYFFDVSCKRPINVITNLDVATAVQDVLLFDSSEGLTFCVLESLPTAYKFGYKFIIYKLPQNSTKFSSEIKGSYFYNFYKSLYYVPGDSNAFVGSPYLTKKLVFFKSDEWRRINLHQLITTDHYLRQIHVFTNSQWLVSGSTDGMVCVVNLTTKKKSSQVMTHHKSNYGVAKVIINTSGDLIVALGVNGTLVAKHLCEPTDKFVHNFREFGYIEFDDCESNVDRYVESLDEEIVKSLNEPITRFVESEDPWAMNWITWEKQKEFHEETEQFANEKEAIMTEFNILKGKLVSLLDENETFEGPRKLPISAFALDKFFRDKKIKAAKDEREEVKREIEANIHQLEGVSSWIHNKFWKPQLVVGQSIFGILDDTEVTNYAMSKLHTNDRTILEVAKFKRSVAGELVQDNVIFPWEDYSPEEIKVEYERRSRVKPQTVKFENIEAIENQLFEEDEEELEAEAEKQSMQRLYEGLTTHHFIEPYCTYYSQFRFHNFAQIIIDNYNIAEDTLKLRIYFNEQFNDIMAAKEREMSLVRERIDRINYVHSELELMFAEKASEKLIYPEWHNKEKPETIITVDDSEMQHKRYISPAEQEMLDKKAAEEERMRLARLADNFREQALQTMMDGVLEVRWEDIIKRDPELPECLESEKLPDNYTEEDKAAIAKYEQEVKHVKAERQKYRKILQADYSRVNSLLEDSVEKFDTRLQQFHLMKIKLESAIQQLNLRYVRYIVKHIRRVKELKEINSIKAKIKAKQQIISQIDEKSQAVKEIEQELQKQYDLLVAKDKLMEKKLMSDFQGLKKNANAAVIAQYKRRPRIALKHTSADEGLDLAKSITTMERLPYLTSESLDYLRQLDNLDIRPSALSLVIESNHWQNLVALRRLKIAHELKMRAMSLALETVMATLSEYVRRQSRLQKSIATLDEQMRNARAERTVQDRNVHLQLVLKMGQVEDEPLRGYINDDLSAAIVVPQRDIEAVNKAILEVGRRKVHAVERGLRFGRALQYELWEEKRLQTLIDQQNTQLYYTRTTNVTREMKEYLKRKLTGRLDDKTPQRIQKDFDKKRRHMEKLVKDWQIKLVEVSDEVQRMEKNNRSADKKIEKMNVDRCEIELTMDFATIAKQKDLHNIATAVYAEKSAILRKMLENYEEMKVMRDRFENSVCGKAATEYVDYKDFSKNQ